MKKIKLVVSPLAEDDLEKSAIYIARDKKDIASRFLDNFWSTCETLQQMPTIGKDVTRNFIEINDVLENTRSWRIEGFSNFLIFYEKTPREIIILRIINSSRNFSNIFNKK